VGHGNAGPAVSAQLVLHRGAKVRDDSASHSFDDPSGLRRWVTTTSGTVTPADAAEPAARLAAIVDVVQRWVHSQPVVNPCDRRSNCVL
jgi:hypothetical protein